MLVNIFLCLVSVCCMAVSSRRNQNSFAYNVNLEFASVLCVVFLNV